MNFSINQPALATPFDNSTNGFNANNVQEAIEESKNTLTIYNVSYTDFLAKNIEVDYYTFELDQSQLMNGVKFLKDSDGIKYGFDQLFGIFIQKLFSTKNPIIVNNSQRMVCSEFCCRFMEACGFIMSIKPDAITPSDLHEILGNI